MQSRLKSFTEFNSINESGLKALVGKSDKEELTPSDAKSIGRKISKMHGKSRQKYIGIVNFMGASCKIFNNIWSNYKPVDKQRKAVNDKKDYVKEV